MSCEQCDERPLEFPYWWGRATVVIVGCREHVAEIIQVLTDTQAKKIKAPPIYFFQNKSKEE